jgi:peroxiredoxin
MVLLNSEKIKLGVPAPQFTLPSVDGKTYLLNDFSNKKVLVVLFICSHCPYVQAIEDRILELERDLRPQNVQFVGICSNDPTDYPDDSPENLFKRWKAKNYGFPYLIDAEQEVAKDYGAVCTPDIFVFDEKRLLAYHGQLDNNWKDPQGVTRQDLRIAIEQLLAGQSLTPEQTPSMGCSIKWKKRV